MSQPTYSARELADGIDVTYRRVDYWARMELLQPSLAGARGSGSRRRYSQQDLELGRRAAHFLNQGMTLRNAFEHAHRGPGVLAALSFTADDFDLITQALRLTAGPEGVISLDHEQRQRMLAIADEITP